MLSFSCIETDLTITLYALTSVILIADLFTAHTVLIRKRPLADVVTSAGRFQFALALGNGGALFSWFIFAMNRMVCQ
jgi:hypothetical protein